MWAAVNGRIVYIHFTPPGELIRMLILKAALLMSTPSTYPVVFTGNAKWEAGEDMVDSD